MLIVPCSMKTVAGICTGYSDNLLLRAADVTIKERRRLVLCARESPLSAIHLRNLSYLAQLENVVIAPPVLTYYNRPSTLGQLQSEISSRLLRYFGIETEGYREWSGTRPLLHGGESTR